MRAQVTRAATAITAASVTAAAIAAFTAAAIAAAFARREDQECARPEVLPSLEPRAADGVDCGVVQGDGGAGKTRSVKRLSAEMRARGKMVLIAASTNLAATNYNRGMSTPTNSACALLMRAATNARLCSCVRELYDVWHV